MGNLASLGFKAGRPVPAIVMSGFFSTIANQQVEM